MKKINFALLVALMCVTGLVKGQVQQRVWYLKDSKVNFSGVSPVVSACDGCGAEASLGGDIATGNGIHDAEGDKILGIGSGNIYSAYGLLDNLDFWESFDAEPAHIIPKPGSTCEYYVVYTTITAYEGVPALTCDIINYYNTFYAEVDMSANMGAGAVISNGNPLNTCEYFRSSCAVTISPEINASGDRYMYLYGANKIFSQNEEIVKFYVSASGISYVSTIFSGNLPSFEPFGQFETVEFELSHDRTKLAIADYFGDKVYVFHLNPSTGNIIPTAGNNGNGTSDFTVPSTSDKLTGLEFSSSGDYLYVNSINDGVFQIDMLADAVATLPISGSSPYSNSELELAFEPTGDYKIYAVRDDGSTLGSINFSNTSVPTFTANAVTGIAAYKELYSAGYAGATMAVWALPSQIDGEDYSDGFVDATDECCASLEGFTKFTYTATVNATWQPLINPFGNIPVVTIAEELRIPTGKTIHIQNMTFKFNEGAKLVIEPGARLILTNSVLTSMDCEGLMWSGVELQGNASLDQSPTSQQGFLLMQSNSEISNAHNGISVYGRDGLDNIDWSKTGGIVQASNSVFRNNIRDVEYLSYFHQNTGYYRNCEFITDAAINNGSFPYAHVTMYRVKGIGFYGCDFKNTTTGLYGDQNRGKGIKSVDAKYKVTYRCTAILPVTTPCPDVNKDGCVFENLYFGIEATAALADYTIDVRYNDFINNTRAAYLSGLDFAYFVNNHLEVATPFSYSYGLYLNNCTGYTVENNDFSTIYGSATYGVVVVNSNDGGISNAVNEIYRNTFDGFDYAATAGLANVEMSGPNPVTNTGLTFRCNSFDNSITADIMTVSGGISPFQGACTPTALGEPHSQTNNQFSTVPSIVGDFWNGNSAIYQIDYRYEVGAPTYETEPRPGYFNTVNTTLSDCGVFNPATSCPEARYDINNGKLILKISSFKAIADQLSEQIDGGNTQELISVVESGLAPGQLKNILLSYSPYLTDEVLLAVLNLSPSLPHGIIKEIVLANSPVSPTVMTRVTQLGLPNGIYNQIVAAQIGVSQIQELRSEISYWYAESELQYNELARRYIHDTLIVNGEDSLKLLLQSSPNVMNNKLRLSSLLIYQGDYSAAQIVINDLRLIDGGIYSDFCDYQELLISIDQNIKKAYTLQDDPDLKSEVENFAFREDGTKECAGATAMLIGVFDYPIREYIPTYVKPRSMQLEGQTDADFIEPTIMIYPNPAQDYVTIELLLTNDESASLIVYDISGKEIMRQQITNSQSYMTTSLLENGTYVLNIVLPDGSIVVRKLTIAK